MILYVDKKAKEALKKKGIIPKYGTVWLNDKDGFIRESRLYEAWYGVLKNKFINSDLFKKIKAYG